MAKKKGTGNVESDMDFSDMNMDDLGMDDLEFDDVDMGDRKPSARDISKDLAKEAGKGFLDGVIKQGAKKALPDSLTEYSDTGFEYADLAKELGGKSKSKIERSVFGLGKEVKKILPFQVKMLDNFLAKFEAENGKAKQESEDAMREAAIGSSLSNIFDKQLNVQKALAARDEAKGEVDKKERLLTNKMQTDLLSSIDTSTAQSNAFTMQIGKEYYRKSLEVQYKTLYTQLDLLKTTRDYFKGFSVQFDSIAKNTSLPEFVKISTTERYSEMLRNKSAEFMHEKVFGNNKYVNAMKDRIGNLVASKTSDLTDKIDGFTDALGGINSMSDGGSGSAKMIADILAGMGGSSVGGKLINKLPASWIEKVKGNKTLQHAGDGLGALANSPRTLFEHLRQTNAKGIEDTEGGRTPTEKLMNLLRKTVGAGLDVTQGFDLAGSVKGASALSHNQPAIFDIKVHRSITETIPMYLADILKQNTDLARMYHIANSGRLQGFKGVESKLYNFQSRKLSTLSEYKSDIETNVLQAEGKGKRIKSVGSSVLTQAAKSTTDKSLKKTLDSSVSKKLLDGYLQEAGKIEGLDTSFDNLIGKVEDVRLTSMIEANPALHALIETIKKTTTEDAKKNFGAGMTEAKSVYPFISAQNFFKGVSQVAGSKTINAITPEQGSAFTKTLARYVMNDKSHGGSGKFTAATTYDIAEGRFFTSMTESERIILGETLEVMVYELKKIISVGGGPLTRITGLLGAVLTDAESKTNLGANVYQTLHDLDPRLFGAGKVTAKNMIEGTLDNDKDESYIDQTAIKKLVGTKASDHQERTERLQLNHFDRLLTESKNGFLSDVSKVTDQRGIFGKGKALAGVVKGRLGEVKNLAKKLREDGYKKASGKVGAAFDKLGALAGDITEATANSAINAVTEELMALDDELAKMIASEQRILQEQLQALEVLEKSSGEVSQASTRDIANEKKLTKTASDSRIKLLHETRKGIASFGGSIQKLREDISAAKSEGAFKPTDLVKKLVEVSRQEVAKFKTLVDEAEQLSMAS